MKKKFKDRLIGKFLLGSPLIRTAIKSIPLVGDLAGQFMDNTEKIKVEQGQSQVVEGSAEGSITKEEMLPILIRWGIIVGLIIYALTTGDWESAERANEFTK